MVFALNLLTSVNLKSKIKKFIYSFICGKSYSPPEGGRIAFCLQSGGAQYAPVFYTKVIVYPTES